MKLEKTTMTQSRLRESTRKKAKRIGKLTTGKPNMTAGIEYAIKVLDLDKLRK